MDNITGIVLNCKLKSDQNIINIPTIAINA